MNYEARQSKQASAGRTLCAVCIIANCHNAVRSTTSYTYSVLLTKANYGIHLHQQVRAGAVQTLTQSLADGTEQDECAYLLTKQERYNILNIIYCFDQVSQTLLSDAAGLSSCAGSIWPAVCRQLTNIDGPMLAIVHQQKAAQTAKLACNTKNNKSRLRLRFRRYHLQLAFRFGVLTRKLTRKGRRS